MNDIALGICVMCRKRIKEEKETANKIDGLWLCGSGCKDKFLEEKKKWTPAGWDALCQLLYEEHQCISGKVS